MTSERQLIAMHGWCGDSRSWDPWLPLWQSRGWRCSCGERGYGGLDAHQPGWSDVPGLKVVIAHSLGPHLLPASVLQAADALVLLTSFGRFVPAGREGKRVQAALAAMATQLRGPIPAPCCRPFCSRWQRLQHRSCCRHPPPVSRLHPKAWTSCTAIWH